MWRPYNWIMIFSHSLQPLMLLVVSVDRLLSVSLPMKYLGWTSTYAERLVGAVYGVTLAQGILGWYLTLAEEQSASASPFCVSSESIHHEFHTFLSFSQVAYGWASIFVYFVVVVVFVKRSKAAMK